MFAEKTTRTVKPNRQQLVVVIGDNSGSMEGPKAKAAVVGVRQMINECQSRSGGELSLYRVLLILFGNEAKIYPNCERTPVLEIDSEEITFHGDGGGTNLRAALELAYEQISEYLAEIADHPQKNKHPLPLVILYSDGHNGNNFGRPKAAADKLKELTYDSESILIVTAGVAINAGKQPDVKTLKAIASSYEGTPLYVPIQKANSLSCLLAAAGSSAASTAGELYDVIRGYLEHSE